MQPRAAHVDDGLLVHEELVMDQREITPAQEPDRRAPADRPPHAELEASMRREHRGRASPAIAALALGEQGGEDEPGADEDLQR